MSCPANTSGLKSADAAIMARPGKLRGLQVLADGTNAATVVLYDNASAASGTVLAKVVVDATLTTDAASIPEDGIVCANGIYADVTGTGAEYIVYYELG
jgi:hypothetical protein